MKLVECELANTGVMGTYIFVPVRILTGQIKHCESVTLGRSIYNDAEVLRI